jgi:hypothetical protein
VREQPRRHDALPTRAPSTRQQNWGLSARSLSSGVCLNSLAPVARPARTSGPPAPWWPKRSRVCCLRRASAESASPWSRSILSCPRRQSHLRQLARPGPRPLRRHRSNRSRRTGRRGRRLPHPVGPGLANQTVGAGSSRLHAFYVCDWLVPTRDPLTDRGMIGEGVIDIPRTRDWIESRATRAFAKSRSCPMHGGLSPWTTRYVLAREPCARLYSFDSN